MTKISDLHRRWSSDADYRDAYDALGQEFDLARALMEARTDALQRFAQATRTRLRIVFEPNAAH